MARGAARIHSCIDHVTDRFLLYRCTSNGNVTSAVENNAGELLRAVAPIAFWAPSSSLTEPDLVACRSPRDATDRVRARSREARRINDGVVMPLKEKRMGGVSRGGHSKVPAVTLGFWIIKIAATTLGETGGDAVSMSLNLGYAVSSVLFIGLFVVAVAAQIAVRSFHPFLYWLVVIATTTAGTTMADFADRSLGIGYAGGTAILFALLMGALGAWYRSAGSVSVDTVNSPKIEMFYWIAILFSQTLGTALGDWMADTGLGYEGGALVFGAGLAVIAAAYFFSKVSRTLFFWSAFILARPLGATVGDFLDKPVADGGLAISRFSVSALLALFMVACIFIFRQRAERQTPSDA